MRSHIWYNPKSKIDFSSRVQTNNSKTIVKKFVYSKKYYLKNEINCNGNNLKVVFCFGFGVWIETIISNWYKIAFIFNIKFYF